MVETPLTALNYPTHVQGRREESQVKLKAIKCRERLDLMFSSPVGLNMIGWKGGQVFEWRGGAKIYSVQSRDRQFSPPTLRNYATEVILPHLKIPARWAAC